MNIPFVIFNAATGAPLRFGNADEALIELQAGEGERALPGTALTVEANRLVVGAQVRAIRDAAIDAGAPTPFGAVDSDEAARSNVSGAAIGAVIAKSASAPYSVTWTMLDNTAVTLDAEEMITMALAVLVHVNACHERARALRTEIEAAADMAELLAIDVTAGWPNSGLEV